MKTHQQKGQKMINTFKTISAILLVSVVAGVVFSQEPPPNEPMKFDGKEVYRQKLENNPFKPCVDVLCTPSGRNILRDSPWDHLHHHALMFAVGVNDVDFWGEFDDTRGKQIVANTFKRSVTDWNNSEMQRNMLNEVTFLDWVIPNGAVVLKEERSISVFRQHDRDVTLLTWRTRLTTPDSGDTATLGGDHYYGLGMRFDESMDKIGRFFANDGIAPGEIVRGDERLTQCKWMAYTAKLNDEPVTVAVFDSPNNPRLMLAFTMGDGGGGFAYISATVNLFREKMEVTQDKPVDFVYGVAVWDGEQTSETIDGVYQQWLATQSNNGRQGNQSRPR